MAKKEKVLVTGAGGFIGHHLVKYLKNKGYWVRGVDIKKPVYEETSADEFIVSDLRERKNANLATKGIKEAYFLAADMGGMGFISFNYSAIFHNNILINLFSVDEGVKNGVERMFFSSSACVYPEFKQTDANVVPLKEEDAFPAQPQDSYGWEKLMSELNLKFYEKDKGVKVRIARFHNIYGPLGTWDGERAKAPASMCRKVALAKLLKNPNIEIWGDGKQTRSFCYIDDCLEGIYKLMRSDYNEALNIGQDELVTINQLADITADIAGIKINKVHVEGPQGVRGRNSDNTKLKKVLKWTPTISLAEGMGRTYKWVEHELYQSIQSDLDAVLAPKNSNGRQVVAVR